MTINRRKFVQSSVLAGAALAELSGFQLMDVLVADNWIRELTQYPGTVYLLCIPDLSRPCAGLCTGKKTCFLRKAAWIVGKEAEHVISPKPVNTYTSTYIQSWESGVRCAVMQGGQGETRHWAFNDPVKREGKYKDAPPSPEEFRKLSTRVVDLHPITCMQNARTSAGGVLTGIPLQALTVGPVQTWKAEKVSILHAGTHDNPFGQRLTAFMISKKIMDSAVPMSLLSGHPNVQFNYYRGGFRVCETEMH
jgi:hypothetical protein